MARIRSIKPEFWSSPNLPPDPWVRLLYMAMWNWADDNGIGTANPRELLGFAFPNEDHIRLVDFRRMLVEIHRVFGVKFYSVAGRPYFSIPSWERHQKFDRRSKGRYPSPDHPDAVPDLQEDKGSTESHEVTSRARRDVVVGTEEQRNRGTEEKEELHRPTKSSDAFETFWSVYPRKDAKRKAEGAYRAALKRADADTITAGAQRYADDPNREPAFTAMPATWLNADRWGDEPLPARAGGIRDRPSTTDERVGAGLALAAELDAEAKSQRQLGA